MPADLLKCDLSGALDVARLNMSHGSHDDHSEVYQKVREAAEASGRGIGIFADLQVFLLGELDESYLRHDVPGSPGRRESR
jgi:hypothetical protein